MHDIKDANPLCPPLPLHLSIPCPAPPLPHPCPTPACQPLQTYYFLSPCPSPDVAAPLSPGPVPYPTLYASQGKEQNPPKEMGAIEVLLYNMSSMLASVATGYDVRLSNVSPIHPNLNPNKSEEDDRRFWHDPTAGRGTTGLYPHNTYHGQTPHHRTPLPQDIKPLRFTDSPQHATSRPPPRRSSQSPGEPGDLATPPPPPEATGPGLDRPLPPPDYGDAPGSYVMARSARFYQDQLDCDYTDRYDRSQGYKESPRRAPEAPTASHAYSNPNYEPRTPSRVTFGHRRTPSGSSVPYPQYELERSVSGLSSSDFIDTRPPPLAPRRLSRQGSYCSEVERPQTLELPLTPLTPRTPLRSSLRKERYTGPAPTHGRTSPWAATGWSSGGGTPTNENSSSEEVCYPNSKTDSGFVSSSRLVRFSPRGDKYTDWSPTGEIGGSSREVAASARDLPDRRQNRHGSYSADSPGRSRSHPYADYITENDLKKNFDFYPNQ